MCKAKILIVDGRVSIRESRSMLLRQAEYDVVEASFGREALEVSRSHRPDVAVVGMGLPDTTAYELCRLLKSDACTAETLVVQLCEPGTNDTTVTADDYFVEPVEPQVLVGRIGALIRLHSSEQSLREANSLLRSENAMLRQTLTDLQTSHWHLHRTYPVLSMCMDCGKVKTGESTWLGLIYYLKNNGVMVSHGYCPDCAEFRVRTVRCTDAQQ